MALKIVIFTLKQLAFLAFWIVLGVAFFLLLDFILSLKTRISFLSFLYPPVCHSCPNCGACLIGHTHMLYRQIISLVFTFPAAAIVCKKILKNRFVFMVGDVVILALVLWILTNITVA